MHTLVITSTGFLLLVLFVAIASRREAGTPRAMITLLFIPVWLVISIVDLCLGVFQAGHHWVDELGVHSFVFGAPAVAALLLVRRPRPKA